MDLNDIDMSSLTISNLTNRNHRWIRHYIKSLAKKGMTRSEIKIVNIPTPNYKAGPSMTKNFVFEGALGKRDFVFVMSLLNDEFACGIIDKWHELDEKYNAKK